MKKSFIIFTLFLLAFGFCFLIMPEEGHASFNGGSLYLEISFAGGYGGYSPNTYNPYYGSGYYGNNYYPNLPTSSPYTGYYSPYPYMYNNNYAYDSQCCSNYYGYGYYDYGYYDSSSIRYTRRR